MSKIPKLRLTFVCSSLAWAGTEHWTARACSLLAERGHDVELIVRRSELFAPRVGSDVRIQRLPLASDADLGSIARLSGRLRGRDLVVLTRVRDYWLGGLAARLAGVPALLRLGVERRLRDRYVMDRLRYGVLPAKLLVNAEAIRTTLL